MSVEITVRVPDALGHELQQVRHRLPEVLARGLREVLAESQTSYGDERTIIDVLASQPTPEEILALHPSPELQARVSDLLARKKQSGLDARETAELDRYLLLEHLVRLAKGRALQRLHEQA
jgi:hypothetical protein